VDALHGLYMGFGVALTLNNLLYALAGTSVGMLVGVLPGVGPATAVAMLLPLAFSLDATGSIIMLAAVYYGSQYGGTITSVLLNVPGEASSAITCLDGHPMAQNGRAGPALTVAALGSGFAGIMVTIGLIFAAPAMAKAALKFGPPEQFALMVFATALLMGLAGNSIVKALMMGILGFMLGTVGMDPTQGTPRFTFNISELFEGLSFIPVVMGFFGLADMLIAIETKWNQANLRRISKVFPSADEFRRSVLPTVRGTGIGFALGLIPGMMPSISAFLSYVVERAVSKKPSSFGKGAIEGVAGPESANNAHATASLIPLLAIGIPTTPTIAIILGAFLINGLIPGPLLFRDHPQVVWGVIASFFVGNAILLLWNIPLVKLWIAILRIPQNILIGFILTFMIIGAYSQYNNMFGVAVLLVSGLIGYVLKKLDFPAAPLILAMVIGPLMEQNLMQSLEMSSGDLSFLLTRPIAMVLLIAAAGIVAFLLLRGSTLPTQLVREDVQ
jgi:putative tricarboxylic transport membrane protein